MVAFYKDMNINVFQHGFLRKHSIMHCSSLRGLNIILLPYQPHQRVGQVFRRFHNTALRGHAHETRHIELLNHGAAAEFQWQEVVICAKREKRLIMVEMVSEMAYHLRLCPRWQHTDFLGTQGDVWDTQKDMALCLVGATAALVLLSRLHDRQLQRLLSFGYFNIKLAELNVWPPAAV